MPRKQERIYKIIKRCLKDISSLLGGRLDVIYKKHQDFKVTVF